MAEPVTTFPLFSKWRKNSKFVRMKQYLDLLRRIMDEGVIKKDRTGVGTKSIFGHQMRFDLNQGFPLLTTKKVHLKSIIYELLWFINGDTNIKYLKDHGVSIWSNVMDMLKNNPDSRRIIISSWNVAQIDSMALPPCHSLFQFYVADNRLSCQLYQRSADTFLGVPFNIASYALLTMMIAKVCGFSLGDFIHTTGDTHIYLNHFEQVKEQLSRTPRPLPRMVIHGDQKDIFSFKYEDFELVGYDPYPAIKAPVAV